MARTDIDQLVLTMSADIRKLERGLDKAQGKLDSTARDMEKRQRELDKNLAKMGESAGAAFGRASVAAGLAFGAITGYSIKAAADAVELRDAFRIAFGEGAKGAEDYAKVLSEKVGRSQLEIMESMTRFRLLLKDQDAATAEAITRELQARAIDVGSLFNIKDADAIQKFFSGLSGEAEPLKSLGVNLNEAALKAELLRLGFKGTASEASEQAKQVARANIILRETEVAAGNAAETIGSTSNQLKKLQGETRDAAAAFGEQFLPIANRVLTWASDALTAFNALPTGVQNASLALLALTAASGPIAAAIAGLAQLVKAARAAQVAMAAMNGGGAAVAAGRAGLAGGAALGGVGLILGGAGSMIASGAAYKGTMANLGKASNEALEVAIQNARDRINTASSGGLAGAPVAQAFMKDLAALQTEVAKRTTAPLDAALTYVPPAGGFALAPNQLTPTAGSGPGGKGRAAKAKKAAEQEEDLTEITDRLINAREDFTRAQEKALDDATRLRVAELDGQAEVLSLQGDAAKTMAQRRDIELRLLALAIERERVELSARAQSNDPGEAAEARRRLEGLDATSGLRRDQVIRGTQGPVEAYAAETSRSLEELNELTQEWATQGLRDLTTSLADAAVAGEDLGEVAKNVFARMAADMVAQMLSQTAGRAGASILSAIIPGFAGGTSSAPGGAALVGEHGPEIVNLPRGSQVIPNHQLKRTSGGSVVNFKMSMDLTGANGDATIERIARQAAAQGAQQSFAAAMKAAPSRMQKQAWSGT